MQNKENYFDPKKIGLSATDLTKIRSVFAKYTALDKVWLYGSRAKGNFRPYSDIDITLEGPALTPDIRHEIEWALDDLYLPYTFDVSILATIDNQDLLEHIKRVGVLIYKTENDSHPEERKLLQK